MHTRWFASLALFLLTITTLYSQTANTSNPIAPTFQSKVHVVLVDVTVTDNKGQPVTGLQKDDFKILEEGKPQTIASFEEHKGVPPSEAAEQSPFATPLAPNFYTNNPLNKPADSVNVLLLDALNTPLGDQANVRRQMVSYLKGLQPGNRLAIFTLGSHMRIVEGFTADPAVLLAALNNKKFGGGLVASPMLLSEVQGSADQQALDTMGGAHASGGAIAAMSDFLSESEGFQNKLRVETTLGALQQLARYLGGFPGRKNLIWFSGSFPALDLHHLDNDPLLVAIKEKIQQTTNMLAAAQIAIYPITAQGLEADSLYTGSFLFDPNATPPAGMPNQGSATNVQLGSLYGDRDTRILQHTGMDDLARDTGGKAFYNTNGLSDAMNDVITNGSHYYTISYAPTDKRTDGRYRPIEVKLGKGHYKLSYRRGYFAESSKEVKLAEKQVQTRAETHVLDDPLQPMMARGIPDATQILYQVHVQPKETELSEHSAIAGDNAKFKGPAIRYGVDFEINTKDLDLEAAPDNTRHGTLEVSLIAYDHDGNILNWMTRRIELSYSPERYVALRQSGIPFHLEMDVPKGDVYLRTGVYEESTRTAGTLEIPLKDVVLPSPTVPVSVQPVQNPSPEPKKLGEGKPPTETYSEPGIRATAMPVPFESSSLRDHIEPTISLQRASGLETDAQIASYCTNMTASQEHAGALTNVCEFALSLTKKLPDIICDRETRRHYRAASAWQAGSLMSEDVVTQKVAYRGGQEYYSDDDTGTQGKSINSAALKPLVALDTQGEFSTMLQQIFFPINHTEFHFEKEKKLNGTSALMFRFSVEQPNNHLYLLHFAWSQPSHSVSWFPAYHGRIWIDAATSHLLRLDRETAKMPEYPIKRVKTEIDYTVVPLGDGTTFVLPTNSDELMCIGLGNGECSHNIIKFTNWQKFGAKTEILMNSSQ
jgi:VWFA-related protein